MRRSRLSRRPCSAAAAGRHAAAHSHYNAATVPIIQLALSGRGLSEQNLGDLGINVVRTRLVTVPGAAIPYPFGGKTREVQIDLDANAMQARGLGGQDVATRSRHRI